MIIALIVLILLSGGLNAPNLDLSDPAVLAEFRQASLPFLYGAVWCGEAVGASAAFGKVVFDFADHHGAYHCRRGVGRQGLTQTGRAALGPG